MPSEISVNDQSVLVNDNENAVLPLIVSGSRNTIYFNNDFLTNSGGGPAVRLIGVDNYLILHHLTLAASGGVAIEGSLGLDRIVSLTASILGNVVLGEGDDVFSIQGGVFNGVAQGGAGDDILTGATFGAALHFQGDDGDDILTGGLAADILDGGTGSDWLEGQLGNDTLIGGGGDNDVAVFFNYLADTTVNLVNGTGTLIDNGGSFSDVGTDSLTDIHIVRFRDQQIDFRLTRNELLLDQAGQSFTNSVNRYGFYAADIVANGVTLINNAEIRGTAVQHSIDVGGVTVANAQAFALRVRADNVTIQNGASGAIIGFAEAIGVHYQNGEPVTGSGLTIENAGLIRSIEGAAIGAIANGVTVTNLAGATIEAETYAIVTPNANAAVTNAGTIISHRAQGSYALRAGTLDLQNSGTIIGGFETMHYVSNITNTGTISGDSRAYGGLTLINQAGSIAGLLRIDVAPVAGQGNPSYTFVTFDNQAAFTGTLWILGTATAFVNLPAPGTVYTSSITNSGTFTGDIISNPTLGTGPGGAALLVSFREVVVNSGTIDGSVWLGSGDDSYSGSGTVTGTVRGEGGNDSLTGGAGMDRIDGGSGNDLIEGGGGNDLLDGGDGIDTVSGGEGDDTIALSAGGSGSSLAGDDGTDRLVVNGAASVGALSGFEQLELGAGAALTLTGAQFAGGLASNAAITGIGSLIVNMAVGQIFFATSMTVASTVALTVNGTADIDVIKGPLTAAISINAGDGTDQIRGGNLADTINGDGGNDKIMGLGGADILSGGAGSDQFRILFAADSGLGSAADRILDFSNGVDKLDFRLLDTDPALAGRQALSFIGTAAFATNGSAQVRYGDVGADTRVEIDLNGDGSADMHILLVGHAGQALSGTDFLL